MIPTIGLIVAVYAIARLLQTPVDASKANNRAALWVVSVVAILMIVALAGNLLLAGADVANLP